MHAVICIMYAQMLQEITAIPVEMSVTAVNEFDHPKRPLDETKVFAVYSVITASSCNYMFDFCVSLERARSFE